jgi:NAD(P)-dependent dehydrogenase (short-subunit alcohol dehydrogenase family)
MRLKGRRAVVTGAAGGIGRALSEGIAREGASVVCIDRDGAGAKAVAGELTAAGCTAHGLGCDLSQIADVEEALRRSVDLLGGVDAVFANAGGVRDPHNKLLPRRVNFLDVDPAMWRQVIDDNLTAAFNVGLVFARWMAQHGGGTFVFTSSQLSEVVRPGLSHYVTAKGGLRQLIKAMAVDLAPHGIRVNAFAPGPTKVPVTRSWWDNEAGREQARREIPLGRMAEPTEMVGAAIFLASEESSFVIGATIMVDGGYTIV